MCRSRSEAIRRRGRVVSTIDCNRPKRRGWVFIRTAIPPMRKVVDPEATEPIVSYATAYRLSRGLVAAIGLFAAIGLMAWARTHRPFESVPVRGTIQQVLDHEFQNEAAPTVKLQLEDGREALVIVPAFVARVGQDVPLIVDRMRKGRDEIRFDHERWLDEAGQ